MASTCTVCELHAESTFKVEGMDCRDEVVLIERRFKHLRGVEAFTADVIGQRLLVKYDAAKLSAAAITGAVADAGMRAWLEHEEPLVVGGHRREAAAVARVHRRRRVRRRPGAGDARPDAVARARRLRVDDGGGRYGDGAPRLERRAGAVARHQRADDDRRRGRGDPRPVVRGCRGDRAVRHRADAGSAHARARAARGRGAARSDAGRRAAARPGGRAPGRRRADCPGRADCDHAGREDPARRRDRRRAERGQSGAGDRRVAARGQGAGRRGVRRHHQRPRRAGGAGHAGAPRHHAGENHPPGRAGAGAARARPDARRSVRARLHAGGGRARDPGRHRCRRCWAAPPGSPGSTARWCCSSSPARARW